MGSAIGLTRREPAQGLNVGGPREPRTLSTADR
jgi:hypothetical protein